jgi:hypothetical protein
VYIVAALKWWEGLIVVNVSLRFSHTAVNFEVSRKLEHKSRAGCLTLNYQSQINERCYRHQQVNLCMHVLLHDALWTSAKFDPRYAICVCNMLLLV